MKKPRVQDGVRVEVLLSREEHDYVKRFAKASDLSVSAIVRLFVTRSLDAVREHLGGVPTTEALAAAFRIALAEIEMEKSNG